MIASKRALPFILLQVSSIFLSPNHAFQPLSTTVSKPQQHSPIVLKAMEEDSTTSKSTSRNTFNDGFIVDDFETQAQQHIDANNHGKTKMGTINENVLKDGKVVGPTHVLVYDTSLRGMYVYMCLFILLLLLLLLSVAQIPFAPLLAFFNLFIHSFNIYKTKNSY